VSDAPGAGEPAQQQSGRGASQDGVTQRSVSARWRVLVALQVLALALVIAAVVAAWVLGLTQPVYNAH
jgi:hypothetical protein